MKHQIILVFICCLMAVGCSAQVSFRNLSGENVEKASAPSTTTTTTTSTPSTSPSEEIVTSSTSSSNPRNETEDAIQSIMYNPHKDNATALHCRLQQGMFFNHIFVGKEIRYDLEKILESLGGLPGKVNATWLNSTKDEEEEKFENANERPLPDKGKWIYDYRKTDFETYVRLEHAFLRFKGTPQQFLDVRGEVYWTPSDFCGNSRYATYRKDDTGFHVEVKREWCSISEKLYCQGPIQCFLAPEESLRCIAAPSSALLASLVG